MDFLKSVGLLLLGILKRLYYLIPSLFTDPFDFLERWFGMTYEPPQWLFWLLLSLGIMFAIILAYHEVRVQKLKLEGQFNARPSVVFNGFSPDSAIMSPINKRAFFTRIEFVNNLAYPTGDNSTARELVAQIKVISNNTEVDAWEGRWANTDAPLSTGDIWLKNRINLPANNQLAILDIGYRFEGEREFIGWDNTQHFSNLRRRIVLTPGDYKIAVALGGSNMEYREFIFAFDHSRYTTVFY